MPLWRTKSNHSQTPSESDPKNDPVASASQAAGTAWLAGHPNHLTEQQEKSLQDFKKLCEENGYYKADAGEGKPSHDDATMLRFLRARKFGLDGAWNQFKDTEDWRKENAIEALYENIDVDSYEAARRMYPQWTGRRDKRGIPIYVFEIKHLDNKNMAEYLSTMNSSTATAETHSSSKVPQRLLRLFALYENLLRFVMPMCTRLSRPNPEAPIVTSTNIVDVSGVGLKQFWNLKGHMQDASVLATAHYPETLDRIFIIGAPAFFPTVWGWIKRWFDPGTTSKIFILSAAEVKPTLTSFMDPSSIPKQYGGDLDWKWNDMPNLDEPARELLSPLETPPAEGEPKPTLMKGPVLFQGDHIEVLGKVNGESRKSSIPVPTPSDSAAAPAQDEKTDQEKPQSNDTPVEKPAEVTETTDSSATENEKVSEDDVAAEKLANGGGPVPTQTVSA